MVVLYLHGLASSPGSRKAQFFAARLRALGHRVEIPDLNEGDFEGLTTTRAVNLALRHLDGAAPPILIFGSSFGGRVGALAAMARPERVAGVILMAPAFDLQRLWLDRLGPAGIAEWKETGTIAVDHYALGGEVPLSYAFFKDAARTDGAPTLPPGLPALVFHGRGDDVVPIGGSRTFAAVNPETTLIELDSDHQLLDRTEQIWARAQPFIQDALGS